MSLLRSNYLLKLNEFLRKGYVNNCCSHYEKQRKHFCTLNLYNTKEITVNSSYNLLHRSNRNKYNNERKIENRYLYTTNRQLCPKELTKNPNAFGESEKKKYDDEIPMDKDEMEEEYLFRYSEKGSRLRPGQYANLIKSHIEKGDLNLAKSVLDLIKSNHGTPTVYLYGLIIRAFAVQGDVDTCFKLYNRLKKNRLKPTAAIYNSLINACAESKNTFKALKYLESLRMLFMKKNVILNETHYITLIKAYSWHNEIKKAFSIADEANDRFIVSKGIFAALFHAAVASKESGLTYALILWHQMGKYKIKPETTHYNLLLRAMKQCKFGELRINDVLVKGLPQTQIILSDDISVSNLLNSPPVLSTSLINLVKYNTSNSKKIVPKEPVESWHLDRFLVGVNKLFLFGGLQQFFENMESNNVVPDFKIMTTLLDVIPNSKKVEEEVIAYVNKKKIEVDIGFFNALIKRRNLRRDYTDAKDVLNIIQAHNLAPDLMTFGALAIGCETLHYANQFLEQMHFIRYRPNHVIIGAMMHNAIARNDCTYIVFLLKYIQDNKIRCDSSTLGLLDKFDKRMLEFIRAKDNRFNRNIIKKMSLGYNRFKIEYDAWKAQLEEKDIVTMMKKQN